MKFPFEIMLGATSKDAIHCNEMTTCQMETFESE